MEDVEQIFTCGTPNKLKLDSMENNLFHGLSQPVIWIRSDPHSFGSVDPDP